MKLNKSEEKIMEHLQQFRKGILKDKLINKLPFGCHSIVPTFFTTDDHKREFSAVKKLEEKGLVVEIHYCTYTLTRKGRRYIDEREE